jgi:RHS repeat-associated protein
LSGGVSASFLYDGLGRRRAKTVSGASTGFLYDGLNTKKELASGSPSANILPGLEIDEWLTRTDGAGARHFLVDAVGSTLALADGVGAVQTQYTYEPFGATSVSRSSSENASQFTGRENDVADLHDYRTRYYSSTLQRFVSEDPIGFAGGINSFVYAGNAPTQLIDPLGLKPTPGFGPSPQTPPSPPPVPPRSGSPSPSTPKPPAVDPKPPEKATPCDSNCLSNCKWGLVRCISAVVGVWTVVHGGAAFGCLLTTGVGGLWPCMHALEPGLSFAGGIILGGGMSAGYINYEIEVRRCRACP